MVTFIINQLSDQSHTKIARMLKKFKTIQSMSFEQYHGMIKKDEILRLYFRDGEISEKDALASSLAHFVGQLGLIFVPQHLTDYAIKLANMNPDAHVLTELEFKRILNSKIQKKIQ